MGRGEQALLERRRRHRQGELRLVAAQRPPLALRLGGEPDDRRAGVQPARHLPGARGTPKPRLAAVRHRRHPAEVRRQSARGAPIRRRLPARRRGHDRAGLGRPDRLQRSRRAARTAAVRHEHRSQGAGARDPARRDARVHRPHARRPAAPARPPARPRRRPPLQHGVDADGGLGGRPGGTHDGCRRPRRPAAPRPRGGVHDEHLPHEPGPARPRDAREPDHLRRVTEALRRPDGEGLDPGGRAHGLVRDGVQPPLPRLPHRGRGRQGPLHEALPRTGDATRRPVRAPRLHRRVPGRRHHPDLPDPLGDDGLRRRDPVSARRGRRAEPGVRSGAAARGSTVGRLPVRWSTAPSAAPA